MGTYRGMGGYWNEYSICLFSFLCNLNLISIVIYKWDCREKLILLEPDYWVRVKLKKKKPNIHHDSPPPHEKLVAAAIHVCYSQGILKGE